MKLTPIAQSEIRAFTLIEVLGAVLLIAALSVLTMGLIPDTPKRAAEAKLKNDVRTLNTAIDVYTIFGGSLDSVDSVSDLVTKLQTRADAVTATQTAGLTGSLIDPRLTVEMQTTEEATENAPRAIWNSLKKRIEITHSGAVGVKSFKLDTSLASLPIQQEERTPTMRLARTSTWIWDYNDVSSNAGAPPTGVPYNPTPTSFSGPAGPPASGTLDAPLFSIAPGAYPITDYNLNLKLTNPNPSGLSRIRYSVAGGPWQTYFGSPIAVWPGTQVQAFCESVDAGWNNSSITANDYNATPVTLQAPYINTSAAQFDYDSDANVLVTITAVDHPDLLSLEYRIDGGTWQSYTGSFYLYVLDYQTAAATIEARSVAVDSYYLDSSISTASVLPPAMPFAISGATSGSFKDPAGDSGMVTNLAPGESNNFFSWGDPVDQGSDTTPPSSLTFTDANFTDVSAGERFLVGTINYYNGTIQSNTGANTVKLVTDINFNGTEVRTFEFDLELINVPNGSGTPEGDADFVRLQSLSSSAAATIEGSDYILVLEFGETTDSGFSTIDQFNVFESASASGNLYGTLMLAGSAAPLEDSDGPTGDAGTDMSDLLNDVSNALNTIPSGGE